MRTLKIVLIVLALFAVPVMAADDQQVSGALDQIVDKIIAREHVQMETFRQYSPLVETYIQNMKNDKSSGWQPNGDSYFMGRAQLAKGVEVESIQEQGGGIKRGSIYGSTDELGNKVAENPVSIHDLHATMLHCLGIDHKRLTYRFGGRDVSLTDVHGRVVKEILA